MQQRNSQEKWVVAIEERLGDRLWPRGSRYQVMQKIIERYVEIVNLSCPVFTIEEWCALLHAARNFWIEDDNSIPASKAYIRDNMPVWLEEHERADLEKRVSRLRTCEMGALIDVSERYWSRFEGIEMESVRQIVPDHAVRTKSRQQEHVHQVAQAG